MANTSREIVQNGVATYLGGPTFDQESRSYRSNVPATLAQAGLSVVRAHQPKRVSDKDYVLAQNAGRGMGAYIVVEARVTNNVRRCIGGGAGSGGFGRRKLTYMITCHVFHLAHKAYMEDAEADVNTICEAVNDYIQLDPTLGGICYQAGESRYGIRTVVRPSSLADKEVTGTHALITLEAQVMIIA